MPIRHAGKNRMVVAAVVGIVLWWAGLIGTASASLITFNFAGNLNVASSTRPADFASDFHVGDAFHGSYTFNSTAADHIGSPQGGLYNLVNGSFTVDGKTYTMGGLQAGTINITSNSAVFPGTNTADAYTVSFTPEGPSVNGLDPSRFSFTLQGRNHFTSDALPLQPPSLSGLSDNTLRFEMTTLGRGGLLQGELNSLTLAAVPLPGALLLFGSGLISLAALGRIRRARQS